MHGLGEGFLAAARLSTQQQRYIALEHPHTAAKIVLQCRVQQADLRRLPDDAARMPGGHGPDRRTCLATQAGEHLPPVQGQQRPGCAAIGHGTAEQLVMGAGEKLLQGLPFHAGSHAAQQVQRTLVGRADTAIAVDCQQPLAEQPDRLGLQVKTQQPVVLELAHEIAAFDHLGRQGHHGHGVEFALARDVGPR